MWYVQICGVGKIQYCIPEITSLRINLLGLGGIMDICMSQRWQGTLTVIIEKSNDSGSSQTAYANAANFNFVASILEAFRALERSPATPPGSLCITVFLNRLNTFSETIAQFLKTLNTNLRRVNQFVKTTQILLKTDFFHQTVNTAIK